MDSLSFLVVAEWVPLVVSSNWSVMEHGGEVVVLVPSMVQLTLSQPTILRMVARLVERLKGNSYERYNRQYQSHSWTNVFDLGKPMIESKFP